MKKGAFTLIELLIVIAIIAILMAILMPALSLARDQARRIHCIHNVKTLSMAWFMYKDDNDGRLVGGMPQYEDQAPWVRLPPNWQTTGIEEKKKYIKKGLMWPYVKEINVYRCPSDQRKKVAHYKYAFRSFSIAGGLNGVRHTGGWEIIPCINYGDIKRPTTKYVFVEEADPRGVNLGSWVLYPKRKEWVDPFAIWHSKNRSTLGWADGHAGMQRWYSKGLIDWCNWATFEPTNPPFQFYRTPADDEEREEFNFMLSGYAYRSLQ